MKIIFLGDTHATNKDKGLSFKGLLSVFDWFKSQYDLSNTLLIQSGDLFDKSLPHRDEVELPITEKLLMFKESHIINGNHDEGSTGIAISSMGMHSNIHTYSVFEKVNIHGLSFGMMPFIKKDPSSMNEVYGKCKDKFDFRVIHAHPKESNRGIEEVSFITESKIATMHGHQHKPFEYGKNGYSIGVPQTTRNGEQDWIKRYLEFDTETGKLQSIPLPVFYTIKTIEYGEEIEDNINTYNIINAPSQQSAYKKHKHLNIRTGGISLIQKEVEEVKLKDKEYGQKKLIHFWTDWKEKHKNDYRKEVIHEIETQLLKTSGISDT